MFGRAYFKYITVLNLFSICLETLGCYPRLGLSLHCFKQAAAPRRTVYDGTTIGCGCQLRVNVLDKLDCTGRTGVESGFPVAQTTLYKQPYVNNTHSVAVAHHVTINICRKFTLLT